MISTDEVQKILAAKLPGADVTVMDMTGTMDHIEAHVYWNGFEGKSLIEQHQFVNQALHDELEDGRIHALKIKTGTKKPDVTPNQDFKIL